MARFRPVSKFKSYTHQSLCDYSQGITLSMTGNLTFPTPPIDLVAQGATNSAYLASILASGPVGNRGSHAQEVAMLDCRNAVQEQIRCLNGYVDGIAGGNLSIILSAGMVPNEPSLPLGILPAPTNFRSPFSKHTVSGETRLRWDKVNGALAYNIYTAATPTDPFVLIGTVTKTLFIGTGAAGRLAYYTIRAVGTAGLGVESTAIQAYSSF